MPPLSDLLACALCAWYLAFALVKLDWPFSIMKRFRDWSTLGGLLECVYCTLFWTALIVGVLYLNQIYAIIYLGAIAGAGAFINRYAGFDHL